MLTEACRGVASTSILALLDSGMSEADLKIVVMKSIFPNEGARARTTKSASSGTGTSYIGTDA